MVNRSEHGLMGLCGMILSMIVMSRDVADGSVSVSASRRPTQSWLEISVQPHFLAHLVFTFINYTPGFLSIVSNSLAQTEGTWQAMESTGGQRS